MWKPPYTDGMGHDVTLEVLKWKECYDACTAKVPEKICEETPTEGEKLPYEEVIEGETPAETYIKSRSMEKTNKPKKRKTW